MEKLPSVWHAWKVNFCSYAFDRTRNNFIDCLIVGNIECIDTLIKYGCDVNLTDADGRPTLYILALENNVVVARFLLEHSNVNVNLPDNEGRTPLHVASWQGHLEMVELLVSQGM